MAGAVFFLSERTRAAAAAAAILPSAVAAISSLRIGARIKSGSETTHFQVRGVVEGGWVKKAMSPVRIQSDLGLFAGYVSEVPERLLTGSCAN